MPKVYTLGSSSLVSAPGIVRWAINGAAFKKDRNMVANVVASTWSIPHNVALKLVTKETPYIVTDEEAVQFTA